MVADLTDVRSRNRDSGVVMRISGGLFASDRRSSEGVSPVREAMETARALARNEGIFCGISCGGTFAAALKVAHEAPEGAVILAMLPDTGERYLSTALFADLPEGSDPEP